MASIPSYKTIRFLLNWTSNNSVVIDVRTEDIPPQATILLLNIAAPKFSYPKVFNALLDTEGYGRG